jgi:hypothetical protein
VEQLNSLKVAFQANFLGDNPNFSGSANRKLSALLSQAADGDAFFDKNATNSAGIVDSSDTYKLNLSDNRNY